MSNRNSFKISIFLIVSAFIWLPGRLPAQSKNTDIKIKLAQSYERSGELETAVKLYEEVFAKDSTNTVIFDALKRNYLQLKRYDEAIVLIQRFLKRTPKDIGLLAQLGSAYTQKSDERKAIEVWETAITMEPKRETTYRIIAAAATQSRLFEDAIDFYRRGRTACNDPTLFASDIAYLYGIMMNYTEATREYLNLIRQNSAQLQYVISRISSYTERTEGLSATTLVVEDALKKEPDNLVFHQLIAWLYMEGKQFDRAYNVYKFIDDKKKANGNELYIFAESALKENAYETAIKAFQEIMNSYPKFVLIPQVKFGYARTLEESDETTDTLKLFSLRSPFTKNPASGSKSLFTDAAAAYRRVISEYPNTEIAARSLLRLAIIKQEKLFDLDSARLSLETLVKNYSRFPSVYLEAKLQLGDVNLASGDLSAAETQYQSLVKSNPEMAPLREKALLRLAELDFFREKFQESLEKLNNLISNPLSDAANDALDLKIFIQENLKTNGPALKEFAKGELLKRQHKLSEALTTFESIAKQYPKTDVIDETVINIGDILTQMNKYTDAISTYNQMIASFPESIYIDRTLMKTAQIYELGLKDKVKAIEVYQQLLEKYPTSIYSGEARRRIRELRGDTI